jgi:effector-binding domain-containing protein
MPSIVERADQPYLSIPVTVTMRTVSEAADRLPDLLQWAASRGIVPAGPPFLKYDVIDMAGELRVRVGFPVGDGVPDEFLPEGVVAGVLPGGRYVSTVHTGHPATLVEATRDLLEWAAIEGLRWDVTPTDAGEAWGARLEVFLTDPRVERNIEKWQTELLLRLAD